MKYQIITILLLLSFILISSIPFDDAFAHSDNNTSNHYHYYDPPTFEFDTRPYIYGELITATCTPDNSKPTTSIVWKVVNTDTRTEVIYERHQSETFSFLANFDEGNYKIKCRTNFGDGHNGTPWVTFSIIQEIIVDLAQHPQITNYVDINYNPTIHNVSIEWDFGVSDNRTCYTKTDFGIDYMINGTITHDPYHTFFGDDIVLYDVYSMSNDDIVNEDMAIISCEGEISFNITDFELLNDFSGFEFWMTFYEKINDTVYILNEVGMIYSEDVVITPYSCLDSVLDLHASIYYDVTKHLKITDRDMFMKACNSIVESYDGIIPVSYTSVDSVTYEEYPPHNTHIPQSTHNTHNTHNTEKKNNNGSGCSGDCTAPTIGEDNQGKRFVDYGLILNNKSFQANYFKTHMLLQHTEVGKENHLSVIIYENTGAHNIDYLQFGMVNEIGSPVNTFEPRIEIDIQNTSNNMENPGLESILLVDKNNIINNYRVDVSLVPCMIGYAQQCLGVDIYWTFDKVPLHNVLAINGWDNNRNSFTTYFNDGLSVTDPNYVEPALEEPYQYECKDSPLENIQVWTRLNCNFTEYKLKIADEAFQYSEKLYK